MAEQLISVQAGVEGVGGNELPVISAIDIRTLDDTVLVSWTTDVPSIAEVHWGKSRDATDQFRGVYSAGLEHTIIIDNLEPLSTVWIRPVAVRYIPDVGPAWQIRSFAPSQAVLIPASSQDIVHTAGFRNWADAGPLFIVVIGVLAIKKILWKSSHTTIV